MELKDIFSKRLRNARLMRGLSMQQLCVMMNDIVTKQSVSKYERGESMPDSTILIALCKALNISPDYLFRENRSALNNVHYRKLTRLSAKEEKSINLMVEDTIERINEIEDIPQEAETIVIDSSLLIIYYITSTNEKVNLMPQSVGDLPLLNIGKNYIKHSGGISAMNININERWL